jgi:hypothetical protein
MFALTRSPATEHNSSFRVQVIRQRAHRTPSGGNSAATPTTRQRYSESPSSQQSTSPPNSQCRFRALRAAIRHWEVTARVQKAFRSFFSICFDFFLNFLLTWREHAWVSWSVRRGTSCEVVRVRSTHGLHNRTAASLDVGGPGPDLDSGSRRVRASLRDVHVSNEIELN